jgi:hypothetical protein
MAFRWRAPRAVPGGAGAGAGELCHQTRNVPLPGAACIEEAETTDSRPMPRRRVCTTVAFASLLLSAGCGSSSTSHTTPIQSPAQLGLPPGVVNGLGPGVPAVYARFPCPYINTVNVGCPLAKTIVRSYYASRSQSLTVTDPTSGQVSFQCVWAAGDVDCLNSNSSWAVSFQGPAPSGRHA